MKNQLLLIYYFISIFSILGHTQYTAIPDANFEAALAAYDDILGDSQIPTSNISSLISLDVSNQGITNMSGIEDFVSLQNLDCNFNSITSINLTNLPSLQQLEIESNLLTDIDVSSNPFLYKLYCMSNQLTSLDLSNNQNMLYLGCNENPIGNNLDVSMLNNLISATVILFFGLDHKDHIATLLIPE